MKVWRGVWGLMFVLSGFPLACGPAPEGGAEVEALSVEPSGESVLGTEQQELGLPFWPWVPCASELRRVRDIRVGPAGSMPASLVSVEGKLFFTADDGEHGRELWVGSSGARGAVSLVDVRPGVEASVPRFLTPLGKDVVFVADDGVHGPELWRSNGTPQGTRLVADVWPGLTGSAPQQLTVVGDVVYFTANDGVHGRELWRSDGTARGTTLVHEFAPGPASLYLDALTAWDGGLALVSYSATEAVLWSLQERQAPRALFRAGDLGVLFDLTPSGRRLFFLVDAGGGEAALWVTRAAPGTAVPLRDFPGDYPSYLTAHDGGVSFLAGADGFFGEPGDPEHGGELWHSDGTVPGTRMVRDIRPGPRGSLPTGLTMMGGWLYFAADDGVHGRELWRSDGTERGTRLVKDLVPGATGSAPEGLSPTGGWLFFSAATPEHGREAWASDGLAWDTRRLGDIAPDAASSDPAGFVHAGGEVFFLATDGVRDQELWSVPFRLMIFCADCGALE